MFLLKFSLLAVSGTGCLLPVRKVWTCRT